MAEWNLADVWEVAADVVPDRVVQKCGDRTVTWEQFDRRANALASDLLTGGLGHQAKVAAYLYNGIEYLEVYAAAFKAGMVPVNTNYRYGADEVAYLFENADAEAVVFHASFAPLLEQIRERLPKVTRWYVVDDGSPSVTWATPYESVVAPGADRAAAVGPWGRSPDDLLFLYTGGTTGMPKGVMWRHDDLFMVLGGGGNPILGIPPAEGLAEIRTRIEGSIGALLVKALPACPLMHGTGQFSSFLALNGGGCVVIMPNRTFDAATLWQTVQDEQITGVVIVGDAFARPMLAELDAHPDYDLSSLMVITSSGVMWSQETKDGLAKHLPNTILFDSLGSSEAVGVAVNVSGGGQRGTASFSLGPGAKVFTEDGRELQAGSGEIGMLGLPGYLPVGYYKDPEKSATTFRVIDGVRYSIPGDFATVSDDGGIQLLGRGSVVINTGGEKVFPEEVEEVLKLHPAVRDAVCVGVPDERFGETICAVVEATDGATIKADELIEHVQGRLARYKAPRRVLTVSSIGRSPAGKVDYSALRRLAREQSGA
ncbi:MAG TPA: acyl-CoA synthetase [Acidimicrobiales bacterium]|nr:acyl-CoA synthetase [Acidimicrobiales bacterium]